MLPRLTKRAFVDLAIWMIGFGLLAGVIFPFFVIALGVDADQVLTVPFFAATHVVGLLVGAINFGLAKMVFGSRLRLLSSSMEEVERDLREAMFDDEFTACKTEDCMIPVDSEDEIGASAQAFNQLVGTLGRAQEVESALNGFAKTLSSHLEFTPLSQNALNLLLQYSGASAGTILVEHEGELRVAANHGVIGADKLAASIHLREAMRHGECQHLAVPPDLMVENALVDFRPREILVAPVEYNNAPFGAVALATGDDFSSETIRLLDLFRQGLGLALQHSMAHERLQQIAAMDPLTGVYNRRFGLRRLQEEFSRASRNNGHLGLVIFDLDHFKKINDTYGHLVGDRVLIRVANAAQRVFRDGDILVRYGGEEFFAILPGAASNDVMEIGERLRHIVEETQINDGDQKIQVTVSLGAMSFPEFHVEKEEDLIRKADEALYAAKRAGRNRVVLAA